MEGMVLTREGPACPGASLSMSLSRGRAGQAASSRVTDDNTQRGRNQNLNYSLAFLLPRACKSCQENGQEVPDELWTQGPQSFLQGSGRVFGGFFPLTHLFFELFVFLPSANTFEWLYGHFCL